MATARIAVVGDILMWKRQIDAARLAGRGSYSFNSVFREVAPILRRADLTIGNLETTFSGREAIYERRNPATRYPMFNCPDELAGTLRRVGFDVLTTANNHCLDRGERGLRRTLDILDGHGIRHTGTYRTQEDSREYLVETIDGIRVAILAYTYGTNFIPVPKGKPWMVNRIHRDRMISDVRTARRGSDIVLVFVHFGQEFARHQNARQERLVRRLHGAGAAAVLGCHPHVLQPLAVHKDQKENKVQYNRIAAYSMGNFVSEQMFQNPYTLQGAVLVMDIQKEGDEPARIVHIHTIPTWVHTWKTAAGRTRFRILPLEEFLQSPDARLTARDLRTMRKVLRTTGSHLWSLCR